MAVLIAAWVAFMTVAYLSGHIEQITGSVGNVCKSVDANVKGHVEGSAQHLHVINVRLLRWPPAVWGMAGSASCAGGARAGATSPSALLAVAPSACCRSSPTAASCCCASSCSRCPSWPSWPRPSCSRARRRSALAAARLRHRHLLGLLGVFLVARYGNERMDAFTQRELNAANKMYAVAPADSVLMAGGPNALWRYVHYKDYRYKTLACEPTWRQTDVLNASYAAIGNMVADALATEVRPARGAPSC